jgi:F-type H+-transporting ATPase subunit delta
MPAAAAPRRYARALFSLASEESRVDAVREELRRLGAALEVSPELSDVLLQPLYPAAERRRVLEGLAQQLGASSLVKRFYSYLIDQRRLVAFDAIEAEFVRLADEAAGRAKARVRTPQPLSAEQQQRLARALAARAGRAVELEIEVDPTLIGGLVAQLGDTVFDGSLKTQLAQLRSSLLAN